LRHWNNKQNGKNFRAYLKKMAENHVHHLFREHEIIRVGVARNGEQASVAIYCRRYGPTLRPTSPARQSTARWRPWPSSSMTIPLAMAGASWAAGLHS
jgi:hypothetical protein